MSGVTGRQVSCCHACHAARLVLALPESQPTRPLAGPALPGYRITDTATIRPAIISLLLTLSRLTSSDTVRQSNSQSRISPVFKTAELEFPPSRIHVMSIIKKAKEAGLPNPDHYCC